MKNFNLNNKPQDFEILRGKALPEGFVDSFVDIFIKLKYSQTSNIYLLVEVKRGKASTKDFQQLQNYICEFPRRISIPDNIMAMKYSFENMDRGSEYAFEELFNMLNLEVIVSYF